MKKALSALSIVLLAWMPAGANEKWSVHEWGTFTSLQDESGEAIGGINTDDEPVPAFVHRAGVGNVVQSSSQVPITFSKGFPTCHPDITMRMETPVIYFHPPKSATGIQSANVRVTFHGGWLSEFYPSADFTVSGSMSNRFAFGPLLPTSESTLEWNNLKVGGDWPVTNTSAHVWTSPRAVAAASVQMPDGESEKFLFYRGVAHVNSPLRVSRDAQSGELLFQSQIADLPVTKPLPIRSLWLVDIQPDGKLAFRTLPPVALDNKSTKPLAHTPAEFAPGDYSAGNLEKLKAVLLAGLVSEGLYADEAMALLNTWELSYFKNSGLRVFFLVPRTWTDFYLPLEISRPADINRVMVGRIELVTPRQRGLLQEISEFATNQIKEDARQLSFNLNDQYISLMTNSASDARSQAQLIRYLAPVYAGEKPLASIASVPKTYQTYLDLGRFRNALVLDEVKRHPTEGLAGFIKTYNLSFRPVAPRPASPNLLSAATEL